MATETATAQTAAPAPVVTTPSAEAPAVAATAADSTLAAATQEYAANRARRMGKESSIGDKVAAKVESAAAAEDKPADVAATETPAAAEPAIEEVTPAAAVEPVKAKEDEVPAALAQYLREKRAVGRRSAEIEREKAALAKQREEFAAERSATSEQVERAKRLHELKERDPLKAIEEMFGADALKGTLPFDLLARSAELSGEAAPTPERIAEAAAARAKLEIMAEMKAKEEATAKASADAAAKQEAEQKAANERGKEAFFVGLAAQFDDVRDQFQFLSTEGIDIPEVDAYMMAEFNRTRQLPAPMDVFRHFEEIQERKAEKLAATLAKKRGAATEPAKTGKASAAVAPAARVDTRGRAPTVIPARESATARIERIARELDSQLGS